MTYEMCALQCSCTSELVSLSTGKTIVGFQWVYTLNIGLKGNIDCYEACLVANGYTKIYE